MTSAWPASNGRVAIGGAGMPPAGIGRALRRRLPEGVRSWLRFARARAGEALGRAHFPGRLGLDRKLLEHVGHIRGGVFVEAGAYDGITQSNSWHLERALGWRGLLVEPAPAPAARCRRFRRAAVECCALGSFAHEGATLDMHYAGLMTVGEGAHHPIGGSAQAHAAAGGAGARFTAPLVALSTLLDRHGLAQVDLLSLDVEGFELQALEGLDFGRHCVDHLLVETAEPADVLDVLGDRYRLAAWFGGKDFLFRRSDLEARA